MKKCKKCLQEKEDLFFVPKTFCCKDCKSLYLKNYLIKKAEIDPYFIVRNRERSRLSSQEQRNINKKEKNENQKIIARVHQKNKRSKYPEKIKARHKANYTIKRNMVNSALHHWSYNQDHWEDIIELPIKEHYKLHRYIIYDQDYYMYRRVDTMELLDTKQAHLSYYESIKNKP